MRCKIERLAFITLMGGVLGSPGCSPLEFLGTPVIESVSPDRIVARYGNLQVTITGRNFVQGSQLLFDDEARPTTVVNSGRLTADITDADLMDPRTVFLVVENPATDPSGTTARSDPAEFTILPEPQVSTIEVEPDGQSVAVGGVVALTATLHYDDGSVEDGTDVVTWESENDAIATVVDGVVTGVAKGTVKIFARSQGVEGWVTVHVVDQPSSNVVEDLYVATDRGIESFVYDAAGASVTRGLTYSMTVPPRTVISVDETRVIAPLIGLDAQVAVFERDESTGELTAAPGSPEDVEGNSINTAAFNARRGIAAFGTLQNPQSIRFYHLEPSSPYFIKLAGPWDNETFYATDIEYLEGLSGADLWYATQTFSIAGWRHNADDTFTEVAGSGDASRTQIVDLAIDRSGSGCAYGVGRDGIDGISVDLSDGAISWVPGFPLNTHGGRTAIILDDGSKVYIGDFDGSEIHGYTREPNCQLKEIPGSPFQTGLPVIERIVLGKLQVIWAVGFDPNAATGQPTDYIQGFKILADGTIVPVDPPTATDGGFGRVLLPMTRTF